MVHRDSVLPASRHPSIAGPGGCEAGRVGRARVQQPTASCRRRTWAGWLGESKQRRALTYWEDMGQRRRRVIIDVHVGHVPNPHRRRRDGAGFETGELASCVCCFGTLYHGTGVTAALLPQPTAGRREGCNSRVGLEGDDVARRCDSSGPIGSRERGGTPRPATGMPSGEGQG